MLISLTKQVQEIEMRICSIPFYAETFGCLVVAFAQPCIKVYAGRYLCLLFECFILLTSVVLWIFSFSSFAVVDKANNCLACSD